MEGLALRRNRREDFEKGGTGTVDVEGLLGIAPPCRRLALAQPGVFPQPRGGGQEIRLVAGIADLPGPGPGWSTLTIIDAEGRSDHVRIRVR